MRDKKTHFVNLGSLPTFDQLQYLEKLRSEGIVRIVRPGVYETVSAEDENADRKE